MDAPGGPSGDSESSTRTAVGLGSAALVVVRFVRGVVPVANEGSGAPERCRTGCGGGATRAGYASRTEVDFQTT